MSHEAQLFAVYWCSEKLCYAMGRVPMQMQGASQGLERTRPTSAANTSITAETFAGAALRVCFSMVSPLVAFPDHRLTHVPSLLFADQQPSAAVVRAPGSSMLLDDGGSLSPAELAAMRAELEAYKVR